MPNTSPTPLKKRVLVEALHGQVLERLELWDTSGFGDSELLAKRMSQAGNSLSWFLSEKCGTGFRNRAFPVQAQRGGAAYFEQVRCGAVPGAQHEFWKPQPT